MIVIKEDGGLLEADIYAELTLSDYREFEQAVARGLKSAPKIKLLLDFSNMLRYTIDVAWEEIKFSRTHAHAFRRIAIVSTSEEWAPWLSWVNAAFSDADTRLFDNYDDARSWLQEIPERGS